jgi:hypothetical protein
MNNTVIKFSVQRMVCTGCGAEANACCDCGVSYMPKSVRAREAIKANPNKSDRAIAAELGVGRATVQRAREVAHDEPRDERVGRDGKSYSIRQRVADDSDLPQGVIDEAAATVRRRVFLRCAEDTVRKAEQGAGLRDAKRSEIDDEILVTLERVIKAWTVLRDEILNRKGER